MASKALLPATRELYSLYEEYNLKYFAGRLPPADQVTIEYSSRLTASAGMCYPQRRIIRLSTHYHYKFPEEAPLTLLHEMIHLVTAGHGRAFKAWIQKISSLGGKVSLRSLERATEEVYRWKYACTGCGREYLRKRRIRGRGKQYVCGGCRGRLREIKILGL